MINNSNVITDLNSEWFSEDENWVRLREAIIMRRKKTLLCFCFCFCCWGSSKMRFDWARIMFFVLNPFFRTSHTKLHHIWTMFAICMTFHYLGCFNQQLYLWLLVEQTIKDLQRNVGINLKIKVIKRVRIYYLRSYI